MTENPIRAAGRILAAALLVTAAIACAGPASAPPRSAAPTAIRRLESPVPGSIGVAVHADGKRIVVSEVGEPAKSAGLRVGDVVIAYDGVPISDVRQFERLVLESDPGSRASVQVQRDGALRVIEIRVQQIVTASRA